MTQVYTQRLNQLLDQNKTLIAAHQGMATGGIVYNTYHAMKVAIKNGAQFVEFDVTQSLDGTFYIMHEGEETLRMNLDRKLKDMHDEEIRQYTLVNMNGDPAEPVNTLDEFMTNMKQHPDVLLHVDHVDIWKRVILEALDTYEDQRDQIMVKINASNREAIQDLDHHPVKYMTIVVVKNVEELEYILELNDEINIVGIQLSFKTLNDAHTQPDVLKRLKSLGYFTHVNAMNFPHDTKNAFYDDDTSVLEDPDQGWGKLIDMGFDVILTDWTFLLNQYINTRKV